MKRRWYRKILAVMAILLLTACGAPSPPTELAPPGEIVEKAILLQLKQTEQNLSQKLNASTPELELGRIDVKQIEPVYIAKLPAYHLQGSYNLKLKLARQQVNQKKNEFDIYLQRQIEGKTWRWLKKEPPQADGKSVWTSYSIR